MTERVKGGTIERSWLEWTQDMRDWHAVICKVRIDPASYLPVIAEHLNWLEADGFTGQVFIDNTPEQQNEIENLIGRLRFLFSNKEAAINFKIRWG